MSVCVVIAILLLSCNGVSIETRGRAGHWVTATMFLAWAIAVSSLAFTLLVLQRGWP